MVYNKWLIFNRNELVKYSKLEHEIYLFFGGKNTKIQRKG